MEKTILKNTITENNLTKETKPESILTSIDLSILNKKDKDNKPIDLDIIGTYVRLATQTNGTKVCLEELAEQSGCSMCKMARCFNKLIELGFLERERIFEKGRTKGIRYTLK